VPPKSKKLRSLDATQIIHTLEVLRDRVEERFPGSGLGKVISELAVTASETAARIQWIQRPHYLLRVSAATLTLLIVAIIAGLLMNIRQYRLSEFSDAIQAFDSSISSVVFTGAAVLFLVSWESRIKRNRALAAMHELRAMAHIVDMHQLTKDPESPFRKGPPTPSSPARQLTPFQLNRYLDYCCEALALISKLAALHAQDFHDPVVLDAVDDIEDLTSGLSRKIGQKIAILDTLGRSMPA
jgi:hypothetical protein